MIIIRWIDMLSICVQNDLMLYAALLKILKIFWSAKWSTAFFSWLTWPQCSILIGLLGSVAYVYIMQAMCFCWACCLVEFLTNTCKLFVTNDACAFKKKSYLSVRLWDLLVGICVVYLLRYPEKTCCNWKPRKLLLQWFTTKLHAHIHNYLCRHHRKYIFYSKTSLSRPTMRRDLNGQFREEVNLWT